MLSRGPGAPLWLKATPQGVWRVWKRHLMNSGKEGASAAWLSSSLSLLQAPPGSSAAWPWPGVVAGTPHGPV